MSPSQPKRRRLPPSVSRLVARDIEQRGDRAIAAELRLSRLAINRGANDMPVNTATYAKITAAYS